MVGIETSCRLCTLRWSFEVEQDNDDQYIAVISFDPLTFMYACTFVKESSVEKSYLIQTTHPNGMLAIQHVYDHFEEFVRENIS